MAPSEQSLRKPPEHPSIVESDGTEERICAAMDRIVSGKSGSPELTVVNLAKEAGVGRATVNRYPELKALFEQKINDAAEGKTKSANPQILLTQLERTVRMLKAELSTIRGENDRMAQQVLFLTERCRRLLAEKKKTSEENHGSVLDRVTPIESRIGRKPRS